MRSSILALVAISGTALANWNPKICNGAGGCLGISWWPGTSFTCPDNTTLTAQKVAQETLSLDSGNYDVITADKFPKTCLRGVTPPAGATLVMHHSDSGHEFYNFITETCTEAKPTADCYNQNPNPSGETICQIATKSGAFCAQGEASG